jgi:hypothetical protein
MQFEAAYAGMLEIRRQEVATGGIYDTLDSMFSHLLVD